MTLARHVERALLWMLHGRFVRCTLYHTAPPFASPRGDALTGVRPSSIISKRKYLWLVHAHGF